MKWTDHFLFAADAGISQIGSVGDGSKDMTECFFLRLQLIRLDPGSRVQMGSIQDSIWSGHTIVK